MGNFFDVLQNSANSVAGLFNFFSCKVPYICPPMRVATISRWSQYHGVRTWPFVCCPSQLFTLLSLYPHTDGCPFVLGTTFYSRKFLNYFDPQVVIKSGLPPRTQQVRFGNLVGKVLVAQTEYCFCKVKTEKLFLC